MKRSTRKDDLSNLLFGAAEQVEEKEDYSSSESAPHERSERKKPRFVKRLQPSPEYPVVAKRSVGRVAEKVAVNRPEKQGQPIVIGRAPRMTKAFISDSCLGKFRLGKILGRGGTAVVYELFWKDKEMRKPAAAKIMLLTDDPSISIANRRRSKEVRDRDKELDANFEKEAAVSMKMSDWKVGPVTYGSWKCEEDGVGFILTERWDTSLEKWAQDMTVAGIAPDVLVAYSLLPQEIVDKLALLIDVLHHHNYVHGDIVGKNILVRLGPPFLDARTGKWVSYPSDIMLADFGLADTVSEWREFTDEYYQKMIDYYMSKFMNTDKYMTRFEITPEKLREDPRHLDRAFLWQLNF